MKGEEQKEKEVRRKEKKGKREQKEKGICF